MMNRKTVGFHSSFIVQHLNMSKKEEKQPTILVADDEPVNRALIERRLQREGYSVLTAQNGSEAVEKAQEALPDLIILDVMMPVMDGLEACRQIKEGDATRDIP